MVSQHGLGAFEILRHAPTWCPHPTIRPFLGDTSGCMGLRLLGLCPESAEMAVGRPSQVSRNETEIEGTWIHTHMHWERGLRGLELEIEML